MVVWLISDFLKDIFKASDYSVIQNESNIPVL